MRRANPPAPISDFAKQRHRDGVSCGNPAAYIYDANGHGRWCINCRAELGEQAWHPDGADVSPRGIGAVLAGAAFIAFLVLCLMFGYTLAGTDPPVPVHTPTTYSPPTTVVP